jgi:ABC-type antimicrobial peptide transport system permease subunit
MFSNLTAARQQEFGVRLAIGSSRRAIAALVLRQGAVWMVPGLVVGAIGAGIAAGAVRSLLYDVSPLDPVAIGAAILALVACAAVALFVPVRRAVRCDPGVVLR